MEKEIFNAEFITDWRVEKSCFSELMSKVLKWFVPTSFATTTTVGLLKTSATATATAAAAATRATTSTLAKRSRLATEARAAFTPTAYK